MMLHVCNDVRRERGGGGGETGMVRCYGGLVTRRLKDFRAFCLSVHVGYCVSCCTSWWCSRVGCADWVCAVAYICDLVVFPPNLSQSQVIEGFK